MVKIFLMVLVAALTFCSVASAGTVLPNRHFFLNVANDSGVKFDWDYTYYNVDPPPDGLTYPTVGLLGEAPGTYFLKGDGGGTNELGLTNDVTSAIRNVTAIDSPTTSSSGTFYLTNNGGRGFDDNIVLLLAVKGPISDDFSVRITSSGYTWTPSPGGRYQPILPADHPYQLLALDETFTKSDFIYGPQTFRPAPGGTAGIDAFMPMYSGQDPSDTSEYHLMFIDLNAGNIKPGIAALAGETLTDGGAVKIQFSITGMASVVAFNGYGWCSASFQGEGISWTNNTALGAYNASGYSVTYTGPPLVISATPADMATNVPVNSVITATFNTAMNAGTIDNNTFIVEDQFGELFSGAVTYDDSTNTATFTPLSPFVYGLSYSATISNGARDLSGNAVTAKTWTFSTGYLAGDINGSGTLTIEDAYMAMQIAAGHLTPTPQQKSTGDVAPMVNGNSQPDGKIDIGDVMVILLNVVNK